MEPASLNDDDLLFCSPTVLGFGFGDKLWHELVCIPQMHRVRKVKANRLPRSGVWCC